MPQTRRHHHTPEFYLRQFAEPMFGNALRVFEREQGRWDPNPRTPKGVGWSGHLYSDWNLSGERQDDFELFLTESVDTPCAPVLRKAATDPAVLKEDERQLLALLVGFAAARTRNLMESVERERLATDPTDEELLKAWCETIKKPYTPETDRQLLKTSLLGAVLLCATRWQQRILSWNWHFVRTMRDYPFITSDWPVRGEFDQGYGLLTFPISSEVALLVSDHPGVGIPDRGVENVKNINHRTLSRATRFVICHKDSFPGDELLVEWSREKG